MFGYSRLLLPFLLAALLAACASAPIDDRPLIERLPAEFTGVLPCADCPGVAWQLQLRPDNVFLLRQTRLTDEAGGGARPRSSSAALDTIGRWLVSADQQTLLLKGAHQGPDHLAVESAEVLRQLDDEGRPYAGPGNGRLLREAQLNALEPSLRLRGMYRPEPDGGDLFRECESGLEFTVEPGPEAEAMAAVYLQEQSLAEQAGQGDPMLMTVDARLSLPRPAEIQASESGGVPEPEAGTLSVRRFVRGWPDLKCPSAATNAELVGPFWRLAELEGQRVRTGNNQRPAWLRFHSDNRLTGSTGCNQLGGSYQLKGTSIELSELAATRRSCPGGTVLELMYTQALQQTARWNVLGHELELYDSDGSLVAAFVASRKQGR